MLPHAGSAQRNPALDGAVQHRIHLGVHGVFPMGGAGEKPEVLVILAAAAQPFEPNTRDGLIQPHSFTSINQHPVPVVPGVGFCILPSTQRVEIQFPKRPGSGAELPGDPAQGPAVQAVAVSQGGPGIEPGIHACFLISSTLAAFHPPRPSMATFSTLARRSMVSLGYQPSTRYS